MDTNKSMIKNINVNLKIITLFDTKYISHKRDFQQKNIPFTTLRSGNKHV